MDQATAERIAKALERLAEGQERAEQLLKPFTEFTKGVLSGFNAVGLNPEGLGVLAGIEIGKEVKKNLMGRSVADKDPSPLES